MLVSPRNIFALGEAGDLPRPFAAVHPAWRTPYVAIIVVRRSSPGCSRSPAHSSTCSAIFVISRMLAYGSTAAALIVLRRREGPAPVHDPRRRRDLRARARRLRWRSLATVSRGKRCAMSSSSSSIGFAIRAARALARSREYSPARREIAMKRREFVGAGLALAAAWPLRGWSAVLKNVGDVAAKSLDGADIALRGSSIEDFAASLRGDVLLRGQPGLRPDRGASGTGCSTSIPR